MHFHFSEIETLAALAAVAVSLGILRNAWPIARRLAVIDRPDNYRKQHPRPTPLVGGFAIMLPLLLWVGADSIWPTLADFAPIPIAVVICGGGAAILGFIDDRSATSPKMRLLALLALTVAALIVSPQLLPTHFNWGHLASTPVKPWAAYLLVAVGMSGFVNAVNMADGQDGYVAGMFVIWSGCIILAGGGAVAILAAMILPASLVVLAFNLRGKIFLGGVGAYGVTFVFGLLFLMLHNSWGVTGETVMVWLFLPIVDCLRLMVERLLHGRSPFEGDRNHFHHWLHHRFGKSSSLAIYLGLVASTSFAAALVPRFDPALLVTLAAAYLALMWLTAKKRHAPSATFSVEIVQLD